MQRFPVGDAVTIEALTRDPHALNHTLRQAEPVSWVPALGGWLVTARDEAVQVMRDDEVFTVDDPRFSTGQVVGPSMLSLDGDEHRRHRDPFSEAFRGPDLRAHLAEFIPATASDIVQGFVDDGFADLRASLAAPLAVKVMIETLGLDVTREEILGIYRVIVDAVEVLSAGGKAGDRSHDAMTDLSAVVRDAIVRRSPLLRGPSAELASSEVISNVAVVMFGGVETGEAMIANVLWHLLSNPTQLQEVRDDPSLIASAVEESLRLEPAATRVDRYATVSTRFGQVEITKGDLVIVSLSGANRDPAVFQTPDTFDLHRSTTGLNVAFAHGPHACIASHIARAEAEAAVESVLEQMPAAELDDDAVPPIGLVFRKPERLPVHW